MPGPPFAAATNTDLRRAVIVVVGPHTQPPGAWIIWLGPPRWESIQANTDPSTYDILGRRYFVGLTARF